MKRLDKRLQTSLATIRLFGILASPLFGTVYATTTFAQSSGAANELGEIVVTAERRDSTVQKTSISVTAISGPELEVNGITDVDRLTSGIAGVSTSSMGPGRTNFDMRGLSSTGGTSPTVGFYLDDVPLTSNTSPNAAAGKSELDPDLYDLQRVEVLRGPQGTLYGASSMGGTIRLITNQPDLKKFAASTQASGSYTEGGSGNYSANGMVNLPLILDQLALRLVVTDKYDSGFLDRIVLSDFPLPTATGQRGSFANTTASAIHRNANTDHTEMVRATLLYQPTENLSITPSVFLQRLNVGMLSAYDLPPGHFAHYEPVDDPESSSQNFNVYSVRVGYTAGPVRIDSISSETYVNSTAFEDESEGLLANIGPAPDGYYASGTSIEEVHAVNQFTQELRLSSNYDSALQWIGGAFYSNFKDHQHFANTLGVYAPEFGTDVFIDSNEHDQITQKALFGEVSYQFLPMWKVTTGLRYYKYDYTFRKHSTGLIAGADQYGTADASGVSPKVTLTYTPLDNLLLYTTASKGFRPGGPNVRIPLDPSNPADCTNSLHAAGFTSFPYSFKPDSVWNYELGEKFRTDDGRFRVNGALYYVKWDGIQQGVTLSCGYNLTANAGHAVSKGGELEISGKITSSLELDISTGYTNAHLTDLSVPVNPSNGLVIGQQLPEIPEWTYTVGLDHVQPITADLAIHSRLSERFVDSEYDYFATPYPYTKRPSYRVADFRTGLEHDRWSVYAYVDNIFNSHGIVGVQRSELTNITEVTRLVPTRPRTSGIAVHYDF